jgi:hypothetical protein
MLNQQLFFHHFPGSREEGIKRLKALLELIRAEHPGVLLVLTPIPSYQLVQEQPVDSALLKVTKRLPVTYDQGVREERELYETLRRLAAETGWQFVDDLPPLQAYAGKDRLFNNFDYHLLPPASAIIGRAQAATVLSGLAPRQPRRCGAQGQSC